MRIKHSPSPFQLSWLFDFPFSTDVGEIKAETLWLLQNVSAAGFKARSHIVEGNVLLEVHGRQRFATNSSVYMRQGLYPEVAHHHQMEKHSQETQHCTSTRTSNSNTITNVWVHTMKWNCNIHSGLKAKILKSDVLSETTQPYRLMQNGSV